MSVSGRKASEIGKISLGRFKVEYPSLDAKKYAIINSELGKPLRKTKFFPSLVELQKSKSLCAY